MDSRLLRRKMTATAPEINWFGAVLWDEAALTQLKALCGYPARGD
jgi:hypothetical protein